MPDTKPELRLFGLSLDLKVNILALIALLLSISSLLWQATQILRGAQVVMSTGERVNFVRHIPSAQPRIPYLLVNARLDYVNTGAVGRDAIVTSERLVIQFGNLVPYEYRWLHFELFLPDKLGRSFRKTRDGAHSFLVPGSGSETHQTTFVPFREADVQTDGAKAVAVTWRTFLSFIASEPPMTLKFSAVDRLGNQYKTACTVFITDTIIEDLRQNHWATALCEANPSPNGPSNGSTGTPPAPSKPAAHSPFNVE